MLEEDVGNFRGLLYEPTYEHEVMILFGLLIPYLRDNFVIDQYPGTFPDCIALRNGQRVGIEFEVEASGFYDHEDEENLSECNLLVCWRNDIPHKTTSRDGVETLNVKGHIVEILALDKVVAALQKERSLSFILRGPRPDIGEGNEESFFEQLKNQLKNNEKKYDWIKQLYDTVRRSDKFSVAWGRGKRWFTMRIFVKRWGVDPIGVQGDGTVFIVYAGNPVLAPWELPEEVQKPLRELFGHPKQKWPTLPLNTQADFDRIMTGLQILADSSERCDIIWRERPLA